MHPSLPNIWAKSASKLVNLVYKKLPKTLGLHRNPPPLWKNPKLMQHCFGGKLPKSVIVTYLQKLYVTPIHILYLGIKEPNEIGTSDNLIQDLSSDVFQYFFK